MSFEHMKAERLTLYAVIMEFVSVWGKETARSIHVAITC
jgi:hypothetical protein